MDNTNGMTGTDLASMSGLTNGAGTAGSGAGGGDLFSLLQQVSPEILQKMVQAGLFDERSRPLLQRFGIGQELLNTPSAQGRNVGSAYVAASPLEHISDAFKKFVGARMAQQSMTGENDLATQRGQGRLGYLQAIQKALVARQQQLQQQQQQAAASGPNQPFENGP